MGVRKYKSAAALRRKIRAYFASISRTVTVTELADSGKRDDKGHVVYVPVPVHNDDGEEIRRQEFLVPPSESALALWLGISSDTWTAYKDPSKNPDLAPEANLARDIILAWNVTEVLSREGKNTRGIEFNLTANYGFAVKREEKRIGQTLEEYLASEGRDV